MKKNILLPMILMVIILSSCSQYYYTPNSQNIPLVSRKNEVVSSVDFYPAGGGGSGVEFQTAYAAGNHVAIQINGGGGSGTDNSTIPDIFGGGNGVTTNAHGGGGYLEGGVGYFQAFGMRKRFVFESYGIFSLGWMNTTYTTTNQSDENGSINAGMTRLAIQPSLGYKAKHFEIAFSLRASNVKYSNITGDLILDSKSQKDYLNENKKQFFIEPAITVKVGGPSIKGQLQFGQSNDETNRNFPSMGGWLSIGLNFNIYAKKKEQR